MLYFQFSKFHSLFFKSKFSSSRSSSFFKFKFIFIVQIFIAFRFHLYFTEQTFDMLILLGLFTTQLFLCSVHKKVFSLIFLVFVSPRVCVHVSFSAGGGLGGFRLPTSALSLSLIWGVRRSRCRISIGSEKQSMAPLIPAFKE